VNPFEELVERMARSIEDVVCAEADGRPWQKKRDVVLAKVDHAALGELLSWFEEWNEDPD
jgi:hypothetical protein